MHVVEAFGPAALKSHEGAAAFARAYFELFARSAEKPRLVYVNRELRFELRRSLRRLQGVDRRCVEWVLDRLKSLG
jgi:hypothetical protein